MTAAVDGYGAVCGISGYAVAVYVEVHITVDGYLALFYRGQHACVVKAGVYVFAVNGDTPSCVIFTFNAYVAVDGDLCGTICSVACFAPAVGFLDSDTITAVTATNGDIHRSVNFNLACGRILCIRIQPNSVGQGVTSFVANGNDVQLACVDGCSLAVACIYAYRSKNVVSGLQLQGVITGINADVVAIFSVNNSVDIIG